MSTMKRDGRRVIIESDGRLRVGSVMVSLLGGQVDYWLHPASSWPRILDSMRRMGLEMVSCYVPWIFHRTSPGEFEFDGRTDPQKNLVGFLDAATERGFWIFIKPGPWIYDHYMNGGVPLDMSRYHRLHPEFLGGAERFLKAVCSVLRSYLATQGGRIILCQPDNEIDPLPTFRGRSGGFLPEENDPVGETYFSQLFEASPTEAHTFPWWLENVYGNASQWSLESGATRSELATTPVCREQFVRNRPLRHAVLAYLEWYTAEYTQRISAVLRENGIDVPLALNTFPDMEPQNPSMLTGTVDIVGGDYWGANLMPAEKVLRISRHIRQLRTASPIAWAPEYQSITAGELVHVEGVVTPANAKYLTILGMLCGLKGWNWYTIAERSVLYFAPINNYGGPVKDYFESFRLTHEVFRKLDWPTWNNRSDVYLFFSRRQSWDDIRYGAFIDAPVYTHSEYDGGIWMDCFAALHQLDYDVGVVDPTASFNPAVGDGPVLFAGSSAVPVAEQEYLLEIARSGATVVFLSPPPSMDQALQPSSVFSDLPIPVRVVSGGRELSFEIGERVFKARSAFVSVFEESSEVRPLMRCDYGTCAIEVGAGRGRLVLVGAELGREIIAALLRHVGCIPHAWSGREDVYTAVWEREGEYLLVALNVGEQSYEGEIVLGGEVGRSVARTHVEELFSGREYDLTSGQPLNIPVKLKEKSGELYWLQ